MTAWLIQTVIYAICCVITYGLSRCLRCRLSVLTHIDTNGRAWRSWVPVLIALAAQTGLNLWAPPGGIDFSRGVLVLTFWQIVGLFIYVLPAGWLMWRAGAPLTSAGLGRHNLWQGCVIAVVIGCLWCAAGLWGAPGLLGAKLARACRSGSLCALPFLAKGAFAEEFLFRGYLQTRLIAQLGSSRGWLLASLAFALYHLPVFLILYRWSLARAALLAVSLLPCALALGFVMLRTQNVLAPTIFHTIMNYWRLL